MCPTETIGSPSARVIPFDYVTTFQLTGRPQNQLESEVTVNAEGGFVATSIGYGLLVEESEVPIPVNAAAWLRSADVQFGVGDIAFLSNKRIDGRHSHPPGPVARRIQRQRSARRYPSR